MRILVDEFIGHNKVTISQSRDIFEIIMPAFNMFTEEQLIELSDLIRWAVQLSKLPLDKDE